MELFEMSKPKQELSVTDLCIDYSMQKSKGTV